MSGITEKLNKLMKTIGQENNTCGTCLSRKLGILEVYCHKKDKYVSEDHPACKSYEQNPESQKKGIYLSPATTTVDNTIIQKANGRNPYIQPSNVAANFRTTLKIINQAVIELHLETVKYKTGKSSRKHIKRSDLPKIKNYIIANGL